jgi:hypothetical protein
VEDLGLFVSANVERPTAHPPSPVHLEAQFYLQSTMSDSITLRPHLHGSLNDLVESANLGALGKCSIVCELVSLFADYEEEGASLFLDAFLTDELQKLVSTIPQSTCLPLGTTTCDEDGVKRAVKKSAPLVRGCWKLYLAANGQELDFGLFRDSGHPLNVPIGLALNSGGAEGARFVRITKIAQDIVRTSTHEGKEITIHFTNAKIAAMDAESSLASLCDLICSGLDEKLSQSCKTYLGSLMAAAVRGSHGALIAVVSKPGIPSFLTDSTKMSPAISLSDAVELVRRDASAIPQLQAIENIVCGMLCCDGIVVFDTQARVIAYNGFIKLKAASAVGGARRRAYHALCEKVGKGLKAVFFQSQDGASDLKK